MSQQMAVSADARALRVKTAPVCTDRTDGREGHFRSARVACLVRRAFKRGAHHRLFFSTAVALHSAFESGVTRAFADGDNDRTAVAQTAAWDPPRHLRLRHQSAHRRSCEATSLTPERSRGAKSDPLSMIIDETNVARLHRTPMVLQSTCWPPRERSIVAALKDTRVRTVNLSVIGGVTTDSSGTVRADSGCSQHLTFNGPTWAATDAFRSAIRVTRPTAARAQSASRTVQAMHRFKAALLRPLNRAAGATRSGPGMRDYWPCSCQKIALTTVAY
jgi:hypothetical protein